MLNLMKVNSFTRLIGTEPYKLWQKLRQENATEEAMESAVVEIGAILPSSSSSNPLHPQVSPCHAKNPSRDRSTVRGAPSDADSTPLEELTRSQSQSQSEGQAAGDMSSGASDGSRSQPASPRRISRRRQSTESKQSRSSKLLGTCLSFSDDIMPTRKECVHFG